MIANKKMLMAAGLLGFSAHFLVGCEDDDTTAAGGSTSGACYGKTEVAKGDPCWNCIVESAVGDTKSFITAKNTCQLSGTVSGRFPCQGQTTQPESTGTDLCSLCFTAEGGLADGVTDDVKAAAFDTCGGNSAVSGAKCGAFSSVDPIAFSFGESSSQATDPALYNAGYCRNCIEDKAESLTTPGEKRTYKNIEEAIEFCGSEPEMLCDGLDEAAGKDTGATAGENCQFCVASIDALPDTPTGPQYIQYYGDLTESCGWEVCSKIQTVSGTECTACHGAATASGTDIEQWDAALATCGYAPCYQETKTIDAADSVSTDTDINAECKVCHAARVAQITYSAATLPDYQSAFETCGGAPEAADAPVCDAPTGAQITDAGEDCAQCIAGGDVAGVNQIDEVTGQITDDAGTPALRTQGDYATCIDPQACSVLARGTQWGDRLTAVAHLVGTSAATRGCLVCMSQSIPSSATKSEMANAIENCGADDVFIENEGGCNADVLTADWNDGHCKTCLGVDTSSQIVNGILVDGNGDAIINAANADQCSVVTGNYCTGGAYASIAAAHTAQSSSAECEMCFSKAMIGKDPDSMLDVAAAYTACAAVEVTFTVCGTLSNGDLAAGTDCYSCLVGDAPGYALNAALEFTDGSTPVTTATLETCGAASEDSDCDFGGAVSDTAANVLASAAVADSPNCQLCAALGKAAGGSDLGAIYSACDDANTVTITS